MWLLFIIENLYLLSKKKKLLNYAMFLLFISFDFVSNAFIIIKTWVAKHFGQITPNGQGLFSNLQPRAPYILDFMLCIFF